MSSISSGRKSQFEQQNNEIFEWNNIQYSVYIEQDKTWKSILNGISGSAESGQVVAILGSSGAGKTSLLNILAGRVTDGKIDGTVKLNGRRRPKNWTEIIGYVEQEDLLTEFLSVQESIEFSASLRLPASLEKERIHAKVDETMTELGIYSCKSNIIGDVTNRGISGGQKKRVSIAMELVTQPKVLFLDEPTTGLDAFTAQNIIESIKRIAVMQQQIVILTIHQPRPDVLMMFDKIFLITQGKCVFFGDLSQALEHFSSLGYECPSLMNPADYFIDLITIDDRTEEAKEQTLERVSQLIQVWEEIHEVFSDEYSHDDVVYSLKGERRPSSLFQFVKLMQRENTIMMREKSLILATFVQSSLVIILCCIIFFQIDFSSNSGIRGFAGALFIVPTNLMFSTVQPLSTIFPLRSEKIIREQYSKTYSLPLLFLACAIVFLPLRMLAGLYFLLVSYWIIGFRSGCQYFMMFFGITVAFIYAVIAIGLMLGSIFRKVVMVQIFGIVILLIFLFFSGGISDINRVSWIFQWLKYISVIYWYYVGVFQSQLLANPPANVNLAGYNTNLPQAWFSLLMLLVIGTAFYVVGMIGFKFTYTPKIRIS